MTHIHFTLETKEIQNLIEKSVQDNISKNILQTVFNQLMENQRTEYIQATEYERYQRNEQALLASMLEMYVSGVSKRKVSQIVEELCGKNVSKSFISGLTAQLDPMVEAWQYLSLSDKKYPYIMTDVLYLKVREDTRVVSKSCHIRCSSRACISHPTIFCRCIMAKVSSLFHAQCD